MPKPKNGLDKNPGNIHPGRPKGATNIATRLRQLLELDDNFVAVLNAQIEKAKQGDTRAAEFIANRLEGFPKTSIETKEIPPVEIIYIGSNADISGEPTDAK
jgi:hypothetical protein